MHRREDYRRVKAELLLLSEASMFLASDQV
jgi:hypothetical protein